MGESQENRQYIAKPYKLTEETSALITECRADGLYWTDCAKVVGLHRDTLMGWLKRGREGEEPFATHYARWEQARMKAVRNNLRYLRDDEDWRARREWLRFNGYDPAAKVEATVQVTEGPAPADVLEALAARVKAQEDDGE